MYIHTRSRINRQSSIHPRPFARSRVSHHPRRASTMSMAIIVVASSRRRLVASSRRIVAPKSAPAPPWRITIRSNKTSHDAMRMRLAMASHVAHVFAQKVCSMGHPSIHHPLCRSRARDARDEDDDDTDGDVSRDASQVTGEFSRVRDDRGRCADDARRATRDDGDARGCWLGANDTR